jgi:hypothetical protein
VVLFNLFELDPEARIAESPGDRHIPIWRLGPHDKPALTAFADHLSHLHRIFSATASRLNRSLNAFRTPKAFKIKKKWRFVMNPLMIYLEYKG